MSSDRYSRQSFLGPDAEEFVARCTVAVSGLGGGGSHVVQQFAHIGFQNYVLYDGDAVEESNLNRLIGAKIALSLSKGFERGVATFYDLPGIPMRVSHSL